ncbi:unnamed protein product [Diamesa tonsa]
MNGLTTILLFCLVAIYFLQFTSAYPLSNSIQEVSNEELTDSLRNELEELKRVTRQCPFSALAGGLGINGTNGSPDLIQLVNLATQVMTALTNNG